MQYWIITSTCTDCEGKIKEWRSKPMSLREAAMVAEIHVNASDTFVNVRIEYSHQTIKRS